MKLNVMLSSLVVLSLLGNACTDNEKKIEEAVAADQKAKGHEFSVDKEGKLEFQAEIVYFAYDDSSLTSEGMARLDAIATYMKAKTTEKLSVAGHCDQRGSVEYNLALGQRRAESVRKYLETVGIGADRIEAVSFGSEKPAMAGDGEAAWSRNRRAEFALVK